MQSFKTIQAMAEKRKGQRMEELLLPVMDQSKLAMQGDDRFLAMMTKAINQAGFNWTVIHNKWPQFEEAFLGFDPQKLGNLHMEEWDAYVKDKRVVRHWQKIKAVKDNVAFVLCEAKKHGSFASFIAQWPCQDQIGLMLYLKKQGSRLGGQTGQWFLRYSGKDCFVITRDVTLALINAGCDIADNPTSQRDLRKIQEMFNRWHEETGLPYTQLSRIAAFSIGPNYELDHIKREIKKFND